MVDVEKLAIALRENRGKRGIRDVIAEINDPSIDTLAYNGAERGVRLTDEIAVVLLGWLQMTEIDVNGIVVPEPPLPKRLTRAQWDTLHDLQGDGLHLYHGSGGSVLDALRGYGFVQQSGNHYTATERGRAYYERYRDAAPS